MTRYNQQPWKFFAAELFQREAQPDPVYYKNTEYTAAIDKRDYAVLLHKKEYILKIVLQDLK